MGLPSFSFIFLTQNCIFSLRMAVCSRLPPSFCAASAFWMIHSVSTPCVWRPPGNFASLGRRGLVDKISILERETNYLCGHFP